MSVCQNNRIVCLNTTSTKEDQCLLQHHCLFSPAHQFAHVVFPREENAQVYTETK